MLTPRKMKAILAVMATSVLTVVAAPTVTAQNNEAADANDAKAMLVMDLSGSMLEEDVENGSRLDAAKSAANGLVDELPENANLGLMVYGQKVSNSPQDREAGCKDIEVISSVGPINKAAMKNSINGLQASGYTPIGNSLLAAADELGDTGKRSIILVSDGIDTCAPPPVCDVATQLGGDGFDLTIHTVGFRVDDEARKELECVANATGGEFKEASDSRQLAESMNYLTQRELVGYESSGTEFKFADKPEDAQWLGEGRYRTKVVPEVSSGTPKPLYYRIAIPDNHNAIVTLKALPNRNTEGEGEQSLQMKVADATNDSSDKCQKFSTAGFSSGDVSATGFKPATGVFGVISTDPEEGMDPSCDQAQWVVENNVYVTQSDFNAAFRDRPVDVEVEVQFEPQVKESDREQLHEGWTGMGPDSIPAIDFTTPKQITGGPSFAAATELSDGQTYSDNLVLGEMKFYKIPVEWGQRPVVAVRPVGGEADKIAEVSSVLTNPFYDPGSGSRVSKTEGDTKIIASDSPIEFMNRTKNAGGVADANAGNYYLAVGLSEYEGGTIDGGEQPYEISVMLDGEPSQGPDWRPTEQNGPQPSDKPIISDKVAPGWTKSDSQSSDSDDSADGQNGSAEDRDTQNTAEADDGSGSVLTATNAVAAVIVVALIWIIALMIRRLRG